MMMTFARELVCVTIQLGIMAVVYPLVLFAGYRILKSMINDIINHTATVRDIAEYVFLLLVLLVILTAAIIVFNSVDMGTWKMNL